MVRNDLVFGYLDANFDDFTGLAAFLGHASQNTVTIYHLYRSSPTQRIHGLDGCMVGRPPIRLDRPVERQTRARSSSGATSRSLYTPGVRHGQR